MANTTTHLPQAARDTIARLEEAEATLQRIQHEIQDMKAMAERGTFWFRDVAAKVRDDLGTLAAFLGVAAEADLERANR